MNRLGWMLVDRLAMGLKPAERGVVCGDFVELGLQWHQALVELAGLIARRQAALWRDWRPRVRAASASACCLVMASIIPSLAVTNGCRRG